jgi:bilirubin oxidase
MPRAGKVNGGDYFEIAVRQFQQQILPPDMPATTVWSYGSANHPGTFNYPAFTIEARFRKPVRVKWINELVDGSGHYLPHLLPVDPTLHWANPPGGVEGRDSRPSFETTPGPYTGPVPLVTHVHGAHTTDESDGYAEAWFLPAATDIPAGYATEGTWYDFFESKFKAAWGVEWARGSATFQYPNNQRAATLWYHDHTLGMTRLNVYAGPAGFYILRGGPGDKVTGTLPGPAPSRGDPPGIKYYEIPIAIQDRSFNADGSLFYPDSREFFDGFGGPYIPESDIAPIWNPEFFGNTMVVNGRTWPYLEVEQRRYRFRFLNGCNSRFVILKMAADPLAERPVPALLPFWQIGAEGGFLPAPVMLEQLLMSPAERADVIVDFSSLPVGTEVYLINEGPDEPFGGGQAGIDFEAANPETTGQVMRFVVVPRVSRDRSTLPERLKLPRRTPLGPEVRTRQVSLNEEDSEVLPGVGPEVALLGILDEEGHPMPMMWDDPITENPDQGDIEVWEIHNHTMDAHPIHIHEVMFEVVNRESMAGDVREPEAWETGIKDTAIAYPEEITRVKALFDLPGQYVWHCHIVEHEDNEMMRPMSVGPIQDPIP